MSRKLEELIDEAISLPDDDRAMLAGLLLESLEAEPDEGVDEAWAAEERKRWGEIQAGTVTAIPWEDVKAKLFARE